MQEGDRVLITAASGSVGRAAIQIASQIGAVPIAVTTSAAKADELRDAGAAVVIATDSESIVEAVDRETGGAGVDIALDLVTGPGQQDLIQATRKDGTLVAAGFLDARPTPAPGDAPVTVINYRGFELLADPAAVDRMAIFLEEGVRAGGLRPAIDRVFALDDIVEAHRRFDAGLHGGKKIVVTV
jgi:NADPH:quinone reductase-like Zn-dependent oxidoreductase